jgi:hypothetical protein
MPPSIPSLPARLHAHRVVAQANGQAGNIPFRFERIQILHLSCSNIKAYLTTSYYFRWFYWIIRLISYIVK